MPSINNDSATPPSGIHAIRGMLGCCHLLVNQEGAVLLDTGLVGETFLIKRLMKKLGLDPTQLKAILLTHGHLDHTGNAAALKAWSGSTIYAHPEERPHVQGTYPYQGMARGCGFLEAIGRRTLGYQTFEIDKFLIEGEILPFWGGLQVVHLPGHTRGHCGFYSARYQLLFSGDLFASYWFYTHQNLPFLNTEPDRFSGSFAKVTDLNPRWIIPNHYDWFDGELHRKRFFDSVCPKKGNHLKDSIKKDVL